MRPDEIASLLRRAVRQRVLPPGQALNQDELAKRFGVSRIPLREALRTLVGEGLMVMRPGIGAVVTQLDAEEVRELYDLRLHLEPMLAEPVVRQCRRQDVDELADLARRMDAAVGKDTEAWSNLNYLFHRRMYEFSGKRNTIRLVTQVLNLVEPYARMYVHVLGSQAQAQDEHRAMLEALSQADAGKLATLIETSLRTARDRLAGAMQEQDGRRDPLEFLVGE